MAQEEGTTEEDLLKDDVVEKEEEEKEHVNLVFIGHVGNKKLLKLTENEILSPNEAKISIFFS